MVDDNLVNTERRMLKAMLADSSKVWSLSDILTACDWQDQAIAVGAGLGILDWMHISQQSRLHHYALTKQKNRHVLD